MLLCVIIAFDDKLMHLSFDEGGGGRDRLLLAGKLSGGIDVV